MNLRIFQAVLLAWACITATPAMAQNFSSDEVAWDAAVCGDSFGLNLASLVKTDGSPLSATENFNLPVPNDQDLGWGSLSQPDVDPNDAFGAGVVVLTGNGFIFTTPLPDAPITATLNPANGELSGFCFRYGNVPAEIRIFDGATLVDSVVTGPAQTDPVNGTPTFICWENPGGVNVTSIEIEPSEPAPANVLAFLDGEFRFGGCDPDPLTCFEELGLVEDGVAALLDDATGCDAYYLQGALNCIDWMQDDVFWAQPSENRLSQYGGSMFIGAAYTVLYLEHVDDPAADVLIDELMIVLECIVDYEIAYAIENGGNTCYIENAEHFAELGGIIDEDFDNEVIATLAYRLAWLHAYYSTQ